MGHAQRPYRLGSENGAIAVVNGLVTTSHGRLESCTVVARGGRITAVGPPGQVFPPSGTNVLDAGGNLVLPGFVDVRGLQGEDLARQGVTGCLARADRREERGSGPRVLGLRFDVGESGSGDEKEALLDARKRSPEGRVLVVVPADRIGSGELIRWATDQEMAVALASPGSEQEAFRTAVDAGVRYVEAVAAGLDGMHHREPGAMAAALLDDRVMVELKPGDGGLRLPTAELVVRAKGIDRCVLATEGRMPDAVRAAAEIPGVGLDGASRMASGIAARMLRMDGQVGAIAECMAADMVVLTSDYEVAATIVCGALVYEKGAA